MEPDRIGDFRDDRAGAVRRGQGSGQDVGQIGGQGAGPGRRGHIVQVDHANGLEARSHFTPLAVSDFATLMKVRIETGRTHQIRVHARAMGHPVAGDDKYGNDEFNHRLKRHGLRRLFLHAASITFEQADATDMGLSLGIILPDELRAVLGAIGLSLVS